MMITDRVLTFALIACLAWMLLAAASHTTGNRSDFLRAAVIRVRDGALMGCFAFVFFFGSWYYLGVDAFRPCAVSQDKPVQSPAQVGNAVHTSPRDSSFIATR